MKSTQELNDKQKKELENIINNSDKSFRLNSEYLKRLVQAAIILVVIVTMYYVQKNELPLKSEAQVKSEVTNTEIFISMNDNNKLTYELESVSIENEKHESTEINNLDWLTSDINTDTEWYILDNKKYIINKSTKLNNLLIYNNHIYIEYRNNSGNANKELILASNKPGDLELNDIQKISSRFYEKSNSIKIKSYINSFNNSFILLSETIGSGELNINTLRDQMIEIENTIKTSNKNDGIKLKFDKLGEINVSKLIDNPRILYTAEDDVLRIQDYNKNKDLIYITSINNEVINCKPEDLIKTNIKNVFIHKNFGKEGSIGYKTFGITADTNLYIIKFEDDIEKNWFKQLNINIDNLNIERIQPVIKQS